MELGSVGENSLMQVDFGIIYIHVITKYSLLSDTSLAEWEEESCWFSANCAISIFILKLVQEIIKRTRNIADCFIDFFVHEFPQITTSVFRRPEKAFVSQESAKKCENNSLPWIYPLFILLVISSCLSYQSSIFQKQHQQKINCFWHTHMILLGITSYVFQIAVDLYLSARIFFRGKVFSEAGGGGGSRKLNHKSLKWKTITKR